MNCFSVVMTTIAVLIRQEILAVEAERLDLLDDVLTDDGGARLRILACLRLQRGDAPVEVGVKAQPPVSADVVDVAPDPRAGAPLHAAR